MKTNKKGFTIIEVVLVLAIAGLIFLMVFIALPALQRSQRNTQREDDIARFLTAVNDYQTNNAGQTPFGDGTWNGKTVNTFIRRYIDENVKQNDSFTAGSNAVCDTGKTCPQFTDPDGTMYGFKVSKGAAVTTGSGSSATTTSTGLSVTGLPTSVDHMIYVVVNAGCGSQEGTYDVGTGVRQIAMFYVEEGGAVVCNDNH